MVRNLTDIVNGILRVTIHASQATSAGKLSLVTSLILKEGIKFHNVIIKNEQRYVRIEIEINSKDKYRRSRSCDPTTIERDVNNKHDTRYKIAL